MKSLSLHIPIHTNDNVQCEDRNKKLNNRINEGFTNIKGKVVPMHAIKEYKAVEVHSHFVLTSAIRGDKCSSHFMLGERPSVANEQKAGWVPEPIWAPPFRISHWHFGDISDEMLFYKTCYFLILTHGAVTWIYNTMKFLQGIKKTKQKTRKQNQRKGKKGKKSKANLGEEEETLQPESETVHKL